MPCLWIRYCSYASSRFCLGTVALYSAPALDSAAPRGIKKVDMKRFASHQHIALSPEGSDETMTSMREWLESTSEEDSRLYEQYGKPLEKDHKGEYVAIASNGQTILSPDPDEVLRKAVAQFGSGNFALAKIGEKAFDTWLSFSL